MCLILLAIGVSASYPLVIAANRDEFFKRPTQAAGFWPGTDLLAGRDQRQGGSWFGVTRQGRLAMVTNVRSAREETSTRSRGHLVRDFLLSVEKPKDFLAGAVEPADKYPGFNLIAGNIDSLWFGSNRSASPRAIGHGFHGLCNASLDSPWPKVVQGKAELGQLFASDRTDLVDGLFSLLQDRTLAADAELPATGVSLEWERILSARFIHGADYGTRSSTLLVVDRHRQARFIERSFAADGISSQDREFILQF